jgi:hypothetical protein
MAPMIREDHAEASAREGIRDRPLAQVPDRVREAIVKDDRLAIAALVLKVRADPILTIRRVRHVRAPASHSARGEIHTTALRQPQRDRRRHQSAASDELWHSRRRELRFRLGGQPPLCARSEEEKPATQRGALPRVAASIE